MSRSLACCSLILFLLLGFAGAAPHELYTSSKTAAVHGAAFEGEESALKSAASKRHRGRRKHSPPPTLHSLDSYRVAHHQIGLVASPFVSATLPIATLALHYVFQVIRI
jgi:hypothetical protein